MIIWIIEEILQSRAIDEFCRANITICESPSRITCLRFRDIAKEMASWTARASPIFGWQGGLMIVSILMIFPWWSRQTAAWAEKLSLIVVSKFSLKEGWGGGLHFSTTGSGPRDSQALECSRTTLLIWWERDNASKEMPPWKALFRWVHKRSQAIVANIWK